jgi:hypothetical protein
MACSWSPRSWAASAASKATHSSRRSAASRTSACSVSSNGPVTVSNLSVAVAQSPFACAATPSSYTLPPAMP